MSSGLSSESLLSLFSVLSVLLVLAGSSTFFSSGLWEEFSAGSEAVFEDVLSTVLESRQN